MTDSEQAAWVWPTEPPPSPEWKPVPGYSAYEWSHRGRARSIDRTVKGRRYRGQLLTPRPNNQGYLIVTVTGDDGAKKTVLLHRMVLLAHAGPPEPGHETLHGPGGQRDNRWPENLRWGSRPENLADMAANRPPRQEKTPTPCLNHEYCGGYVTRGGRRCHDCVVGIGVLAADLLRRGVPLDKAAAELEYPSHAGLHTLAVKYGGYGVRSESPLRRVINRWKAWLADSDPE